MLPTCNTTRLRHETFPRICLAPASSARKRASGDTGRQGEFNPDLAKLLPRFLLVFLRC